MVSCRISVGGGDILVKMTESDLELLNQYARDGVESAFAEIVRRHVNLFVNSSNVRDREGLDTRLAPGDVIMILPAVSGG